MRVWFVTSRLETGKTITLFTAYSCSCTYINTFSEVVFWGYFGVSPYWKSLFSGVPLSSPHLCSLAKSLGAQLRSEPNAYFAAGRLLTTQIRHTPSLASVHHYLATLHSHLDTKLIRQGMFYEERYRKTSFRKRPKGER